MSDQARSIMQLALTIITLLTVVIGGTLSYAAQGEFMRDNAQNLDNHLEGHETLEADVKDIKEFIRGLE